MTNSEKDEVSNLLPPTYYADRDLAFRIQRMVESWKRAIRSNTAMATELDGMLQDSQHVSKAQDQAAYGISHD